MQETRTKTTPHTYNYAYPLDYFGAASSNVIQSLFFQSTNRRTRRKALTAMTKLAKASKAVPNDSSVVSISLTVRQDGTLVLTLQTWLKQAEEPLS